MSDCIKNLVWVEGKRATSMKELTASEIDQWDSYLRNDCLDLENWNDFFDPENEESDGYNDEIWIETWIWKGTITIKDLYAWPGDNQAGAIFVGDSPEPIFFIGDMDLELSQKRSNGPNRIKTLTPTELEFQKLMDEFGHMRRVFYESDENDERCTEHQQCKGHIKAHEKFMMEVFGEQNND
jgi:hypothetical protein